MAKISRLAGSTGHVLTVFVQDATSTTGAGLTGLAFNSSGLACYYKRNRGTASVAVTLATITTFGTYASGGFKEIDATNLPGFYEFHPPDAALASGSGSVAFLLRGAASMVPCPVEIELTGVDNQDAVRGGMTALPNAGAAAANGLPTFGTGTGQINPASGKVPATVASGDAVDAAAIKTTIGIAGAGLNAIPSTAISMASGLVVAGSSGASVVVSGLPTGKSYVGQHLYHALSGEARTIATQSFASGNYTFGFTGTAGTEAGPFSSVATNDVVAPAP